MCLLNRPFVSRFRALMAVDEDVNTYDYVRSEKGHDAVSSHIIRVK